MKRRPYIGDDGPRFHVNPPGTTYPPADAPGSPYRNWQPPASRERLPVQRSVPSIPGGARPGHGTGLPGEGWPRTASEVERAIRVSRAWARAYRLPRNVYASASELSRAGLESAAGGVRRFVQNEGDEAYRLLSAGNVDEAARTMRALLAYCRRVHAVTVRAQDADTLRAGIADALRDFQRGVESSAAAAVDVVSDAGASVARGLLPLAVVAFALFLLATRRAAA